MTAPEETKRNQALQKKLDDAWELLVDVVVAHLGPFEEETYELALRATLTNYIADDVAGILKRYIKEFQEDESDKRAEEPC